MLIDGQHHFRRSAPADLRLDVFGTQLHHGVEVRVRVGDQRAPERHRRIPVGALGGERAPSDVGNGLLVHRHHAHAGTGFDGHVADGHAAFNRQSPNGAAGKFQRMPVAAGGADLADHRQHDVLGGHPERQRAFHTHLHVLHFLGDQALGGQHVLDLGGADAVRQRAERAMRGGMRIAADHGHARQGGALLRADHMHDALPRIVHLELEDAEVVAVFVQRLHLQARDLVGNRLQPALAFGARGRHVVIGRGDIGVDAPRLAPGQAQAFEGLRRGHFVQDVAVDVDQRRAIVTACDLVQFPQLVVQGPGSHRGNPSGGW